MPLAGIEAEGAGGQAALLGQFGLREQFATNVLTATRFRELMRRMRANRPNDDLEIIRKAYDYSHEHHKGQSRATGEPFLVHPLEVATVLAELKLDPTAIAAGLLHDSIEDTQATIEEIEHETEALKDYILTA